MIFYKKYFFIFVMLIFFLLTLTPLISCSSTKEIKQDEPYTEQDIHDTEVERIHDILQTHCVEALWRAILLKDQKEATACAHYVRDALFNAVDMKEYFFASTLLKSLDSAGYKNLTQEITNKEDLMSLYFDNIPGIGKNAIKASSSVPTGTQEKISTYIDGTVTIWVDLGIKVERGMGFANRVIGSGFFIDKRGYIVTNHHVIAELVDKKNKGYGKVYIKLAEDNETRIPAKVIGWDSVHDLALLKTEIDPPYIFKLGSSKDLYVGDKIYAIGSPLGLERTLTSGVVSATDRKLFTTGSVMQIDAAVNSGNSGGPCIDALGNVQAVVFAGILQYEGLNFAIPIEYLKQALPILYNGGERLFPWLGGYGKTARKGTKPYGLEVEYVLPGSALAKSGIQVGCVLTSLDNRKVLCLEDLQDILRDYVPEVILNCSYIDTEGKNKDCLLYLAPRPENPGYAIYQGDTIQHSFVPLLGIELTPSSTTNSKLYTIKRVLRGSVADESGFSENDPVTIGRVQFNNDKSEMYVEVTAKKRKRGYLDVGVGLGTRLDSPYYF